jgi:hypothetical protein
MATTDFKDYYKILGVSKTATPEEMGIEVTMRQQIQRYVSPELGLLLLKKLPKPVLVNPEPSKVPSEN